MGSLYNNNSIGSGNGLALALNELAQWVSWWRIYASLNKANIDSDNDLSPVWCQAIMWTNSSSLLIGLLAAYFSEISIKIETFYPRKYISNCRLPNGGHFISDSVYCNDAHVGLPCVSIFSVQGICCHNQPTKSWHFQLKQISKHICTWELSLPVVKGHFGVYHEMVTKWNDARPVSSL